MRSFNRSSSTATCRRWSLPLRHGTPLCVDELVWKPPVLDYNHISQAVDAWGEARARVHSHFGVPESDVATSVREGREILLYTGWDAGRRQLRAPNARDWSAILSQLGLRGLHHPLGWPSPRACVYIYNCIILVKRRLTPCDS